MNPTARAQTAAALRAAANALEAGGLGEVAEVRVKEKLVGEREVAGGDVDITIIESVGPEAWDWHDLRGKMPPYGAFPGGRLMIGNPSRPDAGLLWTKERGKPIIHQVWVAPDMQRKGVGKVLLDLYREHVHPKAIFAGPFSRSGEAFARKYADKIINAGLREDEHEDTPFAEEVKDVLARYQEQHDYPATEWAGVERLCYEMARVTRVLAVEVPDNGEPWYDYESSEREQDGKNWRYVIPDPTNPENFVVVNCHSMLHNDVWTLSTTMHSTDDIDPEKLHWLSSTDHWERAMIWEIATARALSAQGFEYDDALRDMVKRLKLQEILAEIAKRMIPGVYKAVTDVEGEEPELRGLSIGVSDATLLPGKIGEHEGVRDGLDYSIITVSPKALADPRYLEQVIKHELIHFMTSKVGDRYPHDSDFQDIATEVKLPVEYRD